jgi:two-component system, OmpR family, KDP operon response regulator KdpE
MIERTQGVVRKAVPPKSGFFTAGAVELDCRARQIRVGDRTAHLTPKETELFWYLISQRGRVVPHRELLAAVWGDRYLDRLNYLHVFITNLRKKIEPDPARPQYILTEPWVGYSFSAPHRAADAGIYKPASKKA